MAIKNLLIRSVPWSWRSRIKDLPVVGPLQRALVRRLLEDREFEHVVDSGPAKGVRFQVCLPEDKGIWTGTYEQEFAAAIAREMGAHRGAVAYDIGGWHGFYAGVLAVQGAGAVHVFEPLPQNQKQIRRMIELNPGLPITLHSAAIGDVDGVTELAVMPNTSMAKLSTSPFQVDAPAERRLVVSIRRLDSVVASGEAPPPAVVKLDIEGAEAAALRGAVTLLDAHRPVLFMEVHSSELMQACSEILAPLGYGITSLDRDVKAAQRRDVFQVVARVAAAQHR